MKIFILRQNISFSVFFLNVFIFEISKNLKVNLYVVEMTI